MAPQLYHSRSSHTPDTDARPAARVVTSQGADAPAGDDMPPRGVGDGWPPDPWSKLRHVIVDHYLDAMGPMAMAVYCILVRHADGAVECFPSITSMAGRLHTGRRQVRAALAVLEGVGLIVTQTGADGGQVLRLVNPDDAGILEADRG